MIGRFARSVIDFNLDAAERKLVPIVKENRRFDLRAIVARPLCNLRPRQGELGRIPQGEKSSQPGLVIDKLDMFLLRNYFGPRLTPDRDATRVVAVAMR